MSFLFSLAITNFESVFSHLDEEKGIIDLSETELERILARIVNYVNDGVTQFE